MFTGIIRAQGVLANVQQRGEGLQIDIVGLRPDWDLEPGASVAVDGVCLTVETLGKDSGTFYLSGETLERTTAGSWANGRRVHLEPAIRAGDPLGGHIVQGHVDGCCELMSRTPSGDDVILEFSRPGFLDAALSVKGSVAIDGVSLTINRRTDAGITVNIIPHTQQETHLGELNVGDKANMEADPVAKQVAEILARQLAQRQDAL